MDRKEKLEKIEKELEQTGGLKIDSIEMRHIKTQNKITVNNLTNVITFVKHHKLPFLFSFWKHQKPENETDITIYIPQINIKIGTYI